MLVGRPGGAVPEGTPGRALQEEEAMSELDNKEKALVALAAAMAAGCIRCAEKLHPMGLAAGATADEIEWALHEGLRARESATTIMRRKAEALLDRPLRLAAMGGGEGPAHVAEFVRIGAAAAANSAAEATRRLESAKLSGAGDPAIATALAIARTVRSKAAGYADEAIDAFRDGAHPGKKRGGEAPAAACGDVARGPGACCAPSPEG